MSFTLRSKVNESQFLYGYALSFGLITDLFILSLPVLYWQALYRSQNMRSSIEIRNCQYLNLLYMTGAFATTHNALSDVWHRHK